jgi:dimethylamine/trimethylamine dehydrogenase
VRLARHDILFEPLEIRSKRFRNRFYCVPHALFPVGRRQSEVEFRRTKAEGGWAAVCGGIISIRPDNWDGHRPRIWHERDHDALAQVADAVQGEGALAGIELGHIGGRADGNPAGAKFYPALSPSQVADPYHPHGVPKAMELDDIRALQDAWVDSAVTAAKLGYDIVYAYGSNGYLPAQFLSPFFNKRRDAYGGSLENRARFWLEVIERFRAEIGDRCLIAVRIAADAMSPYGVTVDETADFVRLADDLVDLWDVNVGFRWSHDSPSSRLAPEASQVHWSTRIREATAKPIVGVGRLTNPDRMAEILRSGVWDLIGAARPSIADPFLPRKIEEGRYGDIRECTGANFCIAMETRPVGLSCVQNPTVGEEYRRGWHPERYPPARDPELDVLVVGAGPAGMECARVLANRGYRRVHLVDDGAHPGGHLLWLTALPGFGELARIVNYRKVQLDRLANVETLAGTHLSTNDVLDYGAELVVVATGSTWIGPDASWHYSPLAALDASPVAVLTPADVVRLERPSPGRRVVIWDGDGSALATGLAERLVEQGDAVVLATTFDRVAPMLDATFEGPEVRRRLRALGVRTLENASFAGVDGTTLLFHDDAVDEPQRVEADAVVLAVQRVSSDALYTDLVSDRDRLVDAGIRGVFRIGDAVAPRDLGFVITDAHRLAREIDGEHPEMPAPPKVEDDTELSAELV